MSDYRSAGQADISKNLVPMLLKHLIHSDQFLDSVALAAVDLGGDAARRSELAAILRRREAIWIAPGIYGWRDPIGTLMLAQYGGPCPVHMPAPHLVAGAMARQYGWRLAMPVTIARHVLGLKIGICSHSVPGMSLIVRSRNITAWTEFTTTSGAVAVARSGICASGVRMTHTRAS